MNICGCLVKVAPRHAAASRAAMEAMAGVEIHAAAEDGRLVVVVEDTGERYASDIILSLHQIPGVLGLTISFHHFEASPERTPPAPGQPET